MTERDRINEAIRRDREEQAKRSSSAAHGWAALRKHIARGLREARRAKRMALRGGAKYHAASEYWEGNIVALVRLRQAFAREMKAPPNAKLCEPAPEDVR